MARDDIADITYVNPGYQPGRFPIIAIGQMPFTFGDARKGTAALDSWYRKYAPTEMKDTHFCLAFIHDPGALHARKKIVMPEDLKGVKVRPAQSTIAELVKTPRRHERPGLGPGGARGSRARSRRCDHLPLGLALSVRHRQGRQIPHRRAALHDRVHLLDEQGQIRIA